METKLWSENLMRKDHSARPRCRSKDNIRMDLREIEWKVVDWVQTA
jgi:hypothetical protein